MIYHRYDIFFLAQKLNEHFRGNRIYNKCLLDILHPSVDTHKIIRDEAIRTKVLSRRHTAVGMTWLLLKEEM